MNHRERFLRVMNFGDFDRLPLHEYGAWEQTKLRWLNEGLPESAFDDWDGCECLEGSKYFGLEPRDFIKLNVDQPLPPLDEKVLEEDDRYIVYTDNRGITRKALKEGTVNNMRMCMDQFLDFPVKDKKTFEEWKKHFENPIEERYPENWEQLVEKWKKRDYPLCLLQSGKFGLYSKLREWVGTEGISYMFYDNRSLIIEMLEFLTDYVIKLTAKALKEVDIDYFYFFEDMAYNHGPLVSPELFKEVFSPYYRRIIDHLNKHGVKLIVVDSDGNINKLIPLFLDTGVTTLFPIETTCGMDPISLRKEYGKALSMFGGIEKSILTKGKQEVIETLKRKIIPFLSEGGYIPHIDHAVPPEVSLENFLYYLNVKKKIIEGRL